MPCRSALPLATNGTQEGQYTLAQGLAPGVNYTDFAHPSPCLQRAFQAHCSHQKRNQPLLRRGWIMIKTTDKKMNTVDALWTLIQGQTKAVRKALTERLLAEFGQVKPKKRVEDITQTAGYKEAMDDIKHGRVYHAESVEDMMRQILG